MVTAIVDFNGRFNCDGICHCGTSIFYSSEEIIRSFNCRSCGSYQKDGLKIIDLREMQTTLNKFRVEK